MSQGINHKEREEKKNFFAQGQGKEMGGVGKKDMDKDYHLSKKRVGEDHVKASKDKSGR